MRSIAPLWRSLASYPLLLLEAGYSVRVQFNAACRLANVKPNILFESRAPHTLLALAEARHGVAIIPSLLRTDRYELSILRVAHRGKPLREGLVVQWDNRRPILPYAANFREALAELGLVLLILLGWQFVAAEFA